MPSASVMSLVIGGGASCAIGIDGRSSRRTRPRTRAARTRRRGGRGTSGPGGAAARQARTDGSAATAADAGRQAADAPTAIDRPHGGRPLSRRAAAAAAGRVGAGGACCGRMTGRVRQRPRGRRFAGQRIFDAQPPRRRHEPARRGRGAGARRGAGGEAPAATAGSTSRWRAALDDGAGGAAASSCSGVQLGLGRTVNGQRLDLDDRLRLDVTVVGRLRWRPRASCVRRLRADGSATGAAGRMRLDETRPQHGRGRLRRLGRLAGLARGLLGRRAACRRTAGHAAAQSGACCACRSTNCRATISSIELDALFTSMPVSCLSRSIASWLDRPSSSATL